MNELILHIEYLLLRHDLLVVPGLGSFVRERKPAFFDSQSQIWFPAREQVSFVSGRFPEDNILIISYCRKYGISRKDASVLISNDIEDLKNTIQNQGKVEFINFGTFYLSTSGNIVFRYAFSHEENNFMCGYLPVQLNEFVSSKTNHISELGIAEENKDEIESNEFSISNVNKDYFAKVRKPFLQTAASLLIIVMASLSFVMPTEVKPDIQMAIAEISEDKSIIPQKVASLENMNDTLVSEITVERKLDEEKNIENAKYHLIVGTFRSISEAENYINTLSVNTDELKCLPTKTLVRVACASSDNLEELKSRLNSKSFKAEYKEAWIWSRYK